MELDRTSGEFVLDDTDISLLGEPAFVQREPFTRAPEIYNRAQQRIAMNNARDMTEYPAGASREQLRGDMNFFNLRLVGIAAGVEPFLPGKASLGDQVEAHLDSWAQQFGHNS